MVRAAAKGFDFRRSLRPSRWWNTRLSILLRTLENEDDLRYLEMVQRDALARIASPRFTDESITKAMEVSSGCLEETLRILQPWSVDDDGREQAVLNDAMTAWEAAYGRMDDPEVQADLQRARDAVQALSKEQASRSS